LSVVSSTVSVYGVAVDSVHGKIYYTAHTADRLKRANLDGTGVEENFIVLPSGSGALDVVLDVANGYIYWTAAYTASAGIWRASLDGTCITQILSKPQVYSIALNVAGNKIYYGLDGNFSIGRCDLNGANNNPTWLANVGSGGGGINGIYGLAVDSTN